MRIFNFGIAILFLVFAFLQINDPDPFIWILIYGSVSVLAVMAMFSYYPRKVIIILLVLYAAYSVVYFPGMEEWLSREDKTEIFDNLAKMQYAFIEESREFLGLWICNAVLIFYLIRSRSVRRTN